jgi:hypothetical protein
LIHIITYLRMAQIRHKKILLIMKCFGKDYE